MKKLIVILLTVLLLAGCQSGAKYTVGVCQLAQHEALDAATKGFVDVLKEEFGDEINIIESNASGDSANCATIVNGFVSDGVDLILANATPALQAAATATNTIPILGTAVTEYGTALGIENFNAIVGGNISGTSDLAPLDQQAQMILDLIPWAKKVGILYCSAEANSAYQVKVVKEYLESKGIEVIAKSFSESNDIASITTALCDEVDALYVPTDNAVASYCGTIDLVAGEKKIPVICGEEGTCKVCGVATLSISYYELGRTTGQMAVRILKGEAKIEEMPIEYYANPIKKYNPEIVKKLGLDIQIPEDYIAIE